MTLRPDSKLFLLLLAMCLFIGAIPLGICAFAEGEAPQWPALAAAILAIGLAVSLVVSQALVARLRRLSDESRRMAERLDAKNQELARVNKGYMEILGFVSHEIKGPLSASLLSAASLQQGAPGELNETQRRLIAIVCRNLEYAADMIRDYLDLSRIEKGEIVPQPARLSVRGEVIEPVIADLAPAIESSRMTVILDVPEELSLSADRRLLRIVFQNLIGNAAKYGREGGRIQVSVKELSDAWEFHVWNEGIGVPADRQHSLFTKFGRILDPRALGVKGTGLGLFIVRDILLRHGGDIRFECEEGRWADFIFTLPKTASAAQP